MAVMMVLMSKRVEKRLGATPAAFPPPIFAGTASVFVFCVSLPPLFVIVEGGLYIGVFRSTKHMDAKMDSIGGPRLKRAWVAWPGQGPTPLGLIWPLGLILLTSWSLMLKY
jgi:hypothetical protein